MAEYINLVAGEPDYGALPAAKIIDYPLERRDYRPFAQAQLALGESAFYLRLIAFETHPDPRSRLMLVLSEPAGALAIALDADGGTGTLPEDIILAKRAVAGEDLQGIYWGAECSMARARLEELLGRRLGAGETLHGNVFKTCQGGGNVPGHFGCLFPSRPVYTLPEAAALCAQDLGPLQVVDY